MDDLERALKAHPFLADTESEYVKALLACANNARFGVGEYLLREGDREDTLYLIRHGSVAIEMPRPGGDPVCLETVGAGDVLGVSLLTPAPAHLECRACEPVVAIAIDNVSLVRKMSKDPRLGFAISMRLLERTYDRLSRARLQRLDVSR